MLIRYFFRLVPFHLSHLSVTWWVFFITHPAPSKHLLLPPSLSLSLFFLCFSLHPLHSSSCLFLFYHSLSLHASTHPPPTLCPSSSFSLQCCVFSSRLMGRGHYVFDRRWDRMRLALQNMVEKHLNAQMWRWASLNKYSHDALFFNKFSVAMNGCKRKRKWFVVREKVIQLCA